MLQVVPFPTNPVVQGNEANPSGPAAFTLLACLVSPPQFSATWNMSGTALQPGGRYTIQQNTSIAGISGTIYGTALLIQMLSYTDAGNYTCVIQPSPPNGPESYSATIQLLLLGKLCSVMCESVTVYPPPHSEGGGVGANQHHCQCHHYIPGGAEL